MSREIKFRAWEEPSKVMDDVYRLEFENIDLSGVETTGNYLDSSVVILMQYTGFKDKNGVEIYEGDIVSHHKQGNREVIYPMSDTFACYGLRTLDGMVGTLQDSEALYEVIGNIYESPELLEQS